MQLGTDLYHTRDPRHNILPIRTGHPGRQPYHVRTGRNAQYLTTLTIEQCNLGGSAGELAKLLPVLAVLVVPLLPVVEVFELSLLRCDSGDEGGVSVGSRSFAFSVVGFARFVALLYFSLRSSWLSDSGSSSASSIGSFFTITAQLSRLVPPLCQGFPLDEGGIRPSEEDEEEEEDDDDSDRESDARSFRLSSSKQYGSTSTFHDPGSGPGAANRSQGVSVYVGRKKQ
uniref:Uncharacterized protein n=1 Tax=Anopheles culicifacies TaxID=139723 RepID=A0A182LWD3_9DIPT